MVSNEDSGDNKKLRQGCVIIIAIFLTHLLLRGCMS